MAHDRDDGRERVYRPDQMVVTWHRNAAARDAFENDPEYREAAKIRDRAVKLVIVTGRSVYGD